MRPSDDDLLVLYEIEWALEHAGPHRPLAVLRRLGGHVVTALISALQRGFSPPSWPCS
jgi:hypothetical protein